MCIRDSQAAFGAREESRHVVAVAGQQPVQGISRDPASHTGEASRDQQGVPGHDGLQGSVDLAFSAWARSQAARPAIRVARVADERSAPNVRPYAAAAPVRSVRTTPGSTTAVRAAGSMSTMVFR